MSKSLLKSNITNSAKHKIIKIMASYISCEALFDLFALYGNKADKSWSFEKKFNFYLENSKIFDYRQQQSSSVNIKERWELKDDEFIIKNKETIRDIAKNLYTPDEPSISKSFDYISVLGGGQISNLKRVKFLKENLLKTIKNKPSVHNPILALTGERYLTAQELQDMKGANLKTEFELMSNAISQNFESEKAVEQKGNAYTTRALEFYTNELACPIFNYEIKEKNKHRPTTTDTLYFLKNTYLDKNNVSILFISSELYVLYQYFTIVNYFKDYPYDIYCTGPKFDYDNYSGPFAIFPQNIRSTLLKIEVLLNNFN